MSAPPRGTLQAQTSLPAAYAEKQAALLCVSLADCLWQVCNMCVSESQQPTQHNYTSVSKVAARRCLARNPWCDRGEPLLRCVCDSDRNSVQQQNNTHMCSQRAATARSVQMSGQTPRSRSVSALCSSAWHWCRLAALCRGNTLLQRQCSGGGIVGVITH